MARRPNHLARPLGSANRSAESFNERLRRLRVSQGLTLKDIAATLGVSKPAVWKWEHGRVMPRRWYISALAEALSVSIPELMLGGHPEEVFSGNVGRDEQASLADILTQCRLRVAAAAGVDVEAVQITITG